MRGAHASLSRMFWLLAVVVTFGIGIGLRLWPSAGFRGVGFDENLYQIYVNMLAKVGFTGYPGIVQSYIDYQRTLTGSILPPMRFLYIGTSYLWQSVSGAPALVALHQVAATFSVLSLGIGFGFAWRLGGRAAGLAVLALLSCSPLQIHMSQHALVDGFFAFWALLVLWLFWENLQRANHRGLLLALGVALALMVMTKENSFFVYVALLVILAANRWLKFGVITRPLLLTMVAGPLLGVVALIWLAGGLDTLLETYRLSVSKNFTLPYAVLTGDGPWHRYVIDYLLVSPFVGLLALGSLFQIKRENREHLFLFLFIATSYLIMANLKYGMNLRYATMWDMPLRLLAFAQVIRFAALLRPRWQPVATGGMVAALCLYDLRQYQILFVDHPLYELVSEGLLRALQILK